MNIYFLQETRCISDKEKIWENEWGYKSYCSSADRAAQGVQILFMNNFQFTVKRTISDNLGRYLIIHIEVATDNFVLANIYGPNSDDSTFYDNLFMDIEEFSMYPIIMGGDFNICLKDIDKYGGRNYIESHRNSREVLLEHMENFDMVDIWRVLNPEKKQYTWRQRNISVQCRLDYFIISTSLINIISSTEITHGFRSDHSFVSLELGKENITRGPGFFKLNTSLLLQKEYINKIRALISQKKNEYTEQNLASDLKWEMIKADIRGESIKYSKLKARERNNRQTTIEKELNDLEQKERDENTEDTNNRINLLQNELKEIYETKTKGSIIRAKCRWLKDGEKNTKYFIGLEKRNYLNKTVNCLYKENGDKVNDINQILQEEKVFYSNLYKEKVVDLEDENLIQEFFVQNENIPKLDEDSKNSCEGVITKEESIKAIKSMPNGKSPGTDGIPIEFYKIFWNDISDILLESFNYSYANHSLSISQKQGIITLLPKKDKDTRYLKNWRPISLLNTDYKIMTKCISSRLKRVLPYIISPNQTGFMKDRYIGFNVRLLFELIEYAEEENKPGIIFSIDFEKAFDSVSWKFLEKCIDYFNFGDSFKKWVNIFTSDISSCVINSGWSTGFFSLQRGVRQGCPLSPYLFLLCAEIFGIGVRYNIDIKGFEINDLVKKLAQFADDTQILLNGTIESLNAAIRVLEKFEKISGMKVNFEKSEVIKLGCLKNVHLEPIKPVKFSVDVFKILGIVLPSDGDYKKIIQFNYHAILTKIKAIVKQWSKRILTLYGKSVIIKSLILPQLIYQLSNLPSPPLNFLKQIDDLIFDFIWANKKHKIKKSQLYTDYERGGLGIPNIFAYSSSLKLKWVKFLVDTNVESDWKHIFLNRSKVGTFIFQTNISLKDAKSVGIKSTFWVDVLQSWTKIHFNSEQNINFKSRHPMYLLWYNSNFKIRNRMLYYKSWKEKGINYVIDILDENGSFLNYNDFSEKFHLNNNLIQYHGVVNVLRQNINREGEVINMDRVLNKLLNVQSYSKLFYKVILENNNKLIERKCLQNWERLTGEDINWEQAFQHIHKVTIDTKLRNFQFKLIHNILPDNRILKKMGVKENDECDFCKSDRDSLLHYLWTCQTAQNFWLEVKTFIDAIFISSIPLSPKSILFGGQFVQNSIDNNTVNFIVLIAKHYLHCCKWTNVYPSIVILKEKVKTRENVEKEIAFQNGKINFHNLKWQKYNNHINNNN